MLTVDFSRLELKPGFRILDVGCGSGRHLGEAARYKDVLAVGSDLSPADLAQARARLNFHEKTGATGGGPWETLAADATRLPFQDQSFDLVICCEVLEHIPDHERAVRELARVLKPGRDLVVSVPRYLPERVCWALSDDYHKANGGHIRIYRTAKLTALLESAGVKVWNVHYAHGLHTPYWWLKCLLGPSRPNLKLVTLYHDLLVWDMMKRPPLTRTLEKLLNPLLGKSLVVYLKKPAA
ncbi:MAG: methyltransferase domain-containing protein [Thermodesulfobacteriota bacterium]